MPTCHVKHMFQRACRGLKLWLLCAAAALVGACANGDSRLATETITMQFANNRTELPPEFFTALRKLDFAEQKNRASQPHFRIFSSQATEEEFLLGIPFFDAQGTSRITVYFSGTEPLSVEGLALYEALVQGLNENLKKADVTASRSPANPGAAPPGPAMRSHPSSS